MSVTGGKLVHFYQTTSSECEELLGLSQNVHADRRRGQVRQK